MEAGNRPQAAVVMLHRTSAFFNPSEQTKKFDPKFIYIKKWVPEFQDFNYPQPIVEHKFARERCLKNL